MTTHAVIWQSNDAAVPLITAAQAVAGDAYAIAHGDHADQLMWRAAGHLARAVIAPRTSGYADRVVIIVGKGNNGGDGYAAALRLVDEFGAHVTVVALDGTAVSLSAEAARYRADWVRSGGRVLTSLSDATRAISRATVVVDAVLGTGASGPLRGSARDAVALLALARSTASMRLVACDLPTGVDADTGAVAAGSVPVDATVTFGAVKRGLMLPPAAPHCGELTVGSLGAIWDTYLDQLVHQTPPVVSQALTAHGAAPELYPYDADKWSRGRVDVIGGVFGTSGAACFAAHGAVRAGAGLIHVHAAAPVAHEIASRLDPAVMLHHVPPADVTESGVIRETWLDASGVLATSDVLVAGPGLSVAADVPALVRKLLAAAPRLVLDADALNVFRDDPSELASHAGGLILTPHRKELARIGGGVDGDDAWQHRMTRVPELARRYDATIVAKGPASVIAAPDGRVWVTPVGSPAAGTGGSGDLLTGIIAGAVARATDVSLAVAKAVWWHARASELAGNRSAGRASASDLERALARVFHELAAAAPTLWRT